MDSPIACQGCKRPLPEHQTSFVGREQYNLWAREGFCSFFCFSENASEELKARDEEIEKRQQEWMSAIDARPERVENGTARRGAGITAGREWEPLVPASVSLRVLSRLLDTVLFGVILGGAGAGVALLENGALSLSSETKDWLRSTALLHRFHWKWWLALFLGSAAFLTICQGASGTTPFKFLSDIAVVTQARKYSTFFRSLVREVLYFFDVVFLGLIAFACMSIGEHRQRLGDFAAGTIVTKFQPGERSVGRFLLAFAGALLGGAAGIAIALLIRV